MLSFSVHPMVFKRNFQNKSIGEEGKAIGVDKCGAQRCIYGTIILYLHETVIEYCSGYRLPVEKFDYPLHTHKTKRGQHRSE